MILFAVVILVCFVFGDLMHRRGASAEVSRKSVHISTCLAIAVFPLFDMDHRELLLIGAVLTLVEAFSHKGVDNLFVPLIAAVLLQHWLPG